MHDLKRKVVWNKTGHRKGKDVYNSYYICFILFFSALLSGLFKVVVHNEVYARVHLGFLGFNFDFFSARICFKGGTSYDVNILQVSSVR